MTQPADHGLQDGVRLCIRLPAKGYGQTAVILIDGIPDLPVQYLIKSIGGNLRIQRYSIADFVESFRIRFRMP